MALSFIGSLDDILCYMTFAMWTQRFIVQIALIWMRYRKFPYPKDAFTVPIFVPIIFLFVCLALLVIPVVQNYHVAIYGTTMMIVGAIVYLTFVFPKSQPSVFRRIDG